jgi:hypothetical protein
MRFKLMQRREAGVGVGVGVGIETGIDIGIETGMGFAHHQRRVGYRTVINDVVSECYRTRPGATPTTQERRGHKVHEAAVGYAGQVDTDSDTDPDPEVSSWRRQ